MIDQWIRLDFLRSEHRKRKKSRRIHWSIIFHHDYFCVTVQPQTKSRLTGQAAAGRHEAILSHILVLVLVRHTNELRMQV